MIEGYPFFPPLSPYISLPLYLFTLTPIRTFLFLSSLLYIYIVIYITSMIILFLFIISFLFYTLFFIYIYPLLYIYILFLKTYHVFKILVKPPSHYTLYTLYIIQNTLHLRFSLQFAFLFRILLYVLLYTSFKNGSLLCLQTLIMQHIRRR